MSIPKPNTDPKPTHKPRQPKRKNTKVTGERSEAAFLNRASDQGFGVAKPWGDSLRYDFILDNGSRLLRIQVKCTESIRMRAYETRATYSVGKGRAVYTTQDIDFIAAHIVPLDIWYIIPVEICTPQPMLRFYPHREAKKMRLEPYREAWHLLESPADKGKEQTGKIELQARADETLYPDIPSRIVILSEASASRSEADAQSKACPEPAEGNPYTSSAQSDTTPTHLPISAAPWPIPPLIILTTRKPPKSSPPHQSEMWDETEMWSGHSCPLPLTLMLFLFSNRRREPKETAKGTTSVLTLP